MQPYTKTPPPEFENLDADSIQDTASYLIQLRLEHKTLTGIKQKIEKRQKHIRSVIASQNQEFPILSGIVADALLSSTAKLTTEEIKRVISRLESPTC